MQKVTAPVLVLISCMCVLGAKQAPSQAGTPSSSNGSAAPTQTAPKKPMIPDVFTNLKVLPPDIMKQDLLAVMKGMSVGMKVRCSQCHVATDDLSEADFPSDEKPTKIAAREMLRTLFDTRAKYPAAQSAAPAK